MTQSYTEEAQRYTEENFLCVAPWDSVSLCETVFV